MTIRIAVYGAGARSELARRATDHGGEIVAVIDPDPRVAGYVSATFPGARLHEPAEFAALLDADQIPGGIDAAIITSPDHTHAEIAIPLLGRGIAVYVEKPLDITTEAADAVLAAAHAGGGKLYIGHNMRHMALVRQMKEIIDRGDIGEVKAIWCRHFVGNGGDYYFKDWHADRTKSGGLLLQKGAHDIDVMHWLAGGYTQRVVGMGQLGVYGRLTDRRDNSDRRMSQWFSLDNWPPLTQRELNPVIDVEDLSSVLMQLDNGVQMTYAQCHYTPDYWRNYTVIGTQGRLENFGDVAGGVIRVWNQRTGYTPNGDAEIPIGGEIEGHGGADALTIAEFCRFVTDGGATDTSPVAARYAVATAAEATASLRDGSNPRDIPGLPADLLAYFDGHQARAN